MPVLIGNEELRGPGAIPHFGRPSGGSITCGNFMILNRVRNTGREGIDEPFFRVGLPLGW